MATTVIRDLKLGPDGDLVIEGGQLQLVADGEAVAQAVRQRLSFIRGEWFLDLEAGLPYFDAVLVKNPNLNAVRAIIRSEVLATPGVADVTLLALGFTPGTRTLTVSIGFTTDLSELVELNLNLVVP